jgi:hypothetical protein
VKTESFARPLIFEVAGSNPTAAFLFELYFKYFRSGRFVEWRAAASIFPFSFFLIFFKTELKKRRRWELNPRLQKYSK